MSSRRTTIHDLLERARADLERLEPIEALRAQKSGALIVDTRTEEQRRSDGMIPDSVLVRLSELEWHLDPDSGDNDPGIGLTDWIIVVCAEGYASSLAASRLKALGFTRATDLAGGFAAWKAAGLPVVPAT